jgi:tetratricopeptide (TPR) repeat protein
MRISVLLLFLCALAANIYGAEEDRKVEELKAEWRTSGDDLLIDSIARLLFEQKQYCASLEWLTKQQKSKTFNPSRVTLAYAAAKKCGGKTNGDSLFKTVIAGYDNSNGINYQRLADNYNFRGKPELAGDYLAAGALIDPKSRNLWLDASHYYRTAWMYQKAVKAVFAYAEIEPFQSALALNYLQGMVNQDSLYMSLIDSIFSLPDPVYNPVILEYQWWNWRGRPAQAYDILRGMEKSRLRDSLAYDCAKFALRQEQYILVDSLKKLTAYGNPDDDEAWTILEAEVQILLGQVQETEKLFEKLWLEKPTPELAKKYGGFLLYKAHDPKHALTVLSEGLRTANEKKLQRPLLRMIIEAKICLGDLNEIKKEVHLWNTLLPDRETQGELAFLEGEIEATQGFFSKALSHWNKVLRLNKGNDVNDAIMLKGIFEDMKNQEGTTGKFWGAWLLALRGDFNGAAGEMTALLKSYYGKERGRIVLLAAHWYAAAGKKEEGRSLLTGEEGLCSDCPEVLTGLARFTLETMDDTAGAVRNYESLLIKYPQSLFAEEARERIRQLSK